MTTERKPSERAVELKACPFCGGEFIPQHPKMTGSMKFTSIPSLEELTEGGWRVICYGCGVQTWDNLNYTQEQAAAAWNTRPPTLETQLAAMLEAIVGELACHRSEHSHAIMDARKLLTTYHQRKETTK